MGAATGTGDPLLQVRTFVAQHRSEVAIVALYSVAVGVFALVTPVAVQALVNTTAFGTVLQPIIVLAVLLLGGLALSGTLRAMKALLVEVLQRRMFVETAAQLAYRLPRVDASVPFAGDPIHRFFELFGAQKAVATLLLGGIDMVLSASVGMLVLAFYHPLLLVFDVGLLAAVLLLVFGAGRNGVGSALEESASKLAFSDFLAQLMRSQNAFRTAHGRAYARARIDHLAQQYLVHRATHYRVVMRQVGGSVALQALASAALLGLGGLLVIRRELTLGQLVAAELIVSAVLMSLSNLGKYAESYYDLVAHLGKLDGLLTIKLEPDTGNEHEERGRGPCEIVIDELHLTREGHPLLEGASCRIGAGSRVVLQGAADSGKTSLLQALFGLHRQQRGRILLDGVDTRELTHEALRARVALVRGPEILTTSILENVRLGDAHISPAQVRTLLEKLGLGDELGRLPRGLDTPLEPGGEHLSDSQRLRLTLARALIRQPGVVAIDASLSLLDAASWSSVARVLTAADAPWTLIIVGDLPAGAADMEVIRLQDRKLVQEVSRAG